MADADGGIGSGSVATGGSAVGGRRLSEELFGELQRSSRSLTVLELARAEVDDAAAEKISASLIVNSTLTHLDLRGNSIGPQGAKRLAAALARNSALTHIDLENNILGAEGAELIAAALTQNKSLARLELGNQFLGGVGVARLAGAMEQGGGLSLKELGLAGTSCGAEGAERLASVLGSHTNLVRLELAGNGIGATGCEFFAAALESNGTLRELGLRGNGIGDRGAEQLAAALRRNGALLRLDVAYNNVCEPGVDALRLALRERRASAPRLVLELRGNAPGSDNSPLAASAATSSASGPPTTTSSPAAAAAGGAAATRRTSNAGGSSATALSPAAGGGGGGTAAAREQRRSSSRSTGGSGGQAAAAAAALSATRLDEILDKIEVCLKRVDLSQGSAGRLGKAETDLLNELAAARDVAKTALEGSDRSLLRRLFGQDCVRLGRLRASLSSVHLSGMNVRDPRFPSCEDVCKKIQEIVSKELGLTAELARATDDRNRALLQSRASVLADPAQSAAFKAQLDEDCTDVAFDDAIREGDEPPEDEDEEETQGTDNLLAANGQEQGIKKRFSLEESEFQVQALQMFNELDSNGDGRITRAELKYAVRHPGEIARQLRLKSYKDCARMLGTADTDLDQSIDYMEFMAYLRILQQTPEPEPPSMDEATVNMVFQAMDQDGDGFLTLQELRCAYAGVLLSAGEKVDQKRVARWAKRNLKKFDSDGSSTLDLDEFRELILRSGALAPALVAQAPAADMKDPLANASVVQLLRTNDAKAPKKPRSRSTSKAAPRYRPKLT